MLPTDSTDSDISSELALLEGLIAGASEPAAARRGDAVAKAAIATGTLIPTVLGAIAAGAAEMEPAAPQAPLPTIRAGQGQPRVFVPIQRTAHVPFTAEHQPTVALRGTPTFALNPTFKAMVASERGLRINTGRVARAAIYRVASGDSLYLIAKRLLGNGARWRELYSANRGKIASPSLLRIGMTLSLPGSALPPLGDTYQVARGDSLYVIAARRLKNANRWREIATLNADRLKGSTMIYPNQVLLLPNV